MQIATDDLYDINYNSVDFTRTASILWEQWRGISIRIHHISDSFIVPEI